MNSLPSNAVMYNALLKKDGSFEGIFFVGVKTTGIFCRPTCRARKPKQKNVEFYSSTGAALRAGYRPCKLCKPVGFKGEFPEWLRSLMEKVNNSPDLSFKDSDLRLLGTDPNRVRRWFKKNHGMTFQAYLRLLRIGRAFGRIKFGEDVTSTAFDSGYGSLSSFTDSFKKIIGHSPSKSSGKELIHITRILTPLGPMLAGATKAGVCLLEFIDRRMLETQLQTLKRRLNGEFFPGNSIHFEKLNKEINEYFAGKRKSFSVPLKLVGSEFQRKVWSELIKIPCGTTRSYKEIAKLIGDERSVRAVANANGTNRIAIIIPCHRVIGSDGHLTGYGGGLWRKRYLLDMEQVNRDY
ncbi:MAG: methylated-DNA--[protein]-cysteine S-methyltransferase [Candidatus Neomarinimicrobiota bacterium]